MAVDPELKINKYNKGKYLLRRAFEGDYLPRDILYREKAAFSDAVGHSMVDYLKEYAEQQYTDEAFEKGSSGVPLHTEPAWMWNAKMPWAQRTGGWGRPDTSAATTAPRTG